MRPDEIAALGDLAGDAAAGATEQIREVHTGIARRVWRRVGPASIPVRIAHDRIARSAYSAAGELTRTIVRAGAQAVSAAQPPDSPRCREARRGGVGQRAQRRLRRHARRSAAIRWRCRWRSAGAAASWGCHELAAAYPHAKARPAAYVHGLCETDEAWNGIPARPRVTSHTATAMEVELGFSPPYAPLQAPAGTSPRTAASSPGKLERLIAAWPVPVDEVVLIGHSMGGLVARSACHYGADSDSIRKVRHVVTLGTPHRGAPLEQVTNAASAALARLPETLPLARRSISGARRSRISLRRPGRRVLAGSGSRRAFARHLARDPVSAERAALLHPRHAVPRAGRRGRPDHRRPARAAAPSASPAPRARYADALPDRALLPSRRRQPLRSSQPPGDLRADPPVRAEPARVAGASSRWPGD